MEEICTIIPLHVLMDMPKEVIFELFGKEKVRPTISVGQRFFVVEDAFCEYTGTQEPRGLKAPFWEIKCDTTIIHMKLGRHGNYSSICGRRIAGSREPDHMGVVRSQYHV